MSIPDHVGQIHTLRRRRHAIILAHNYQPPEVQDIADYVGDSLELSKIAQSADAEVIIFCGVRFMAETAALLAPEKTVLMPIPAARCPMAAMIHADELRELKHGHPAAVVVCYVNSSTAVKAESDVCCTSANVLEIVAGIPLERDVIFIPDQHLGNYVSDMLGRRMVIWPGYCATHARIHADHIRAQRQAHPNAPVIVHPECRREVARLADAVLGTGGMLRYARETDAREMIIGTEIGLLHRLKKENPQKQFYPANDAAICPNMKLTSLASIVDVLSRMEPAIAVPSAIRADARRPIERMLTQSLCPEPCSNSPQTSRLEPLAQGGSARDDA